MSSGDDCPFCGINPFRVKELERSAVNWRRASEERPEEDRWVVVIRVGSASIHRYGLWLKSVWKQVDRWCYETELLATVREGE